MEMHLVGGFLGSGKTTSIINAAKELVERGLKVGVVTNDKGKHLVDTAFFRSSAIPTAEVAGGCFRCNYDELEKQLRSLEEDNHPDVIFCESVGSCADMAATVLQPLLEYMEKSEHQTSFSVFCDVRLLRMWLMGVELPFSDAVVYIFEQQIEEAPILVLNKKDLLSEEQLGSLLKMTKERFPEKQIILQTALLEHGTAEWLEMIQSSGFELPEGESVIDYEKYDKGGQSLAWLDESITLKSEDNSKAVALFVTALFDAMKADEIAIGHVKFFFDDGVQESKLSFPTLEEAGWQENFPQGLGNEVEVIVNGRVECAPAKLNRLVAGALADMREVVRATYERKESVYFRPRVYKERNTYKDETV